MAGRVSVGNRITERFGNVSATKTSLARLRKQASAWLGLECVWGIHSMLKHVPVWVR